MQQMSIFHAGVKEIQAGGEQVMAAGAQEKELVVLRAAFRAALILSGSTIRYWEPGPGPGPSCGSGLTTVCRVPESCIKTRKNSSIQNIFCPGSMYPKRQPLLLMGGAIRKYSVQRHVCTSR